jgi:PAS domain S-box-containing protein
MMPGRDMDRITRIADHLAKGADPADAQFRVLVETVSDYAIYLLDPQGRIASWNAGAERIKGYGPGEVIGRHFSLFYPPEEREGGKPGAMLAQAQREGRVEGEGWRLRKDGSRFWAEVVITALRDTSGTLTGFAKVTRDMTARHAERERDQLLATTFNWAPSGIAVADLGGRYVSANPSFLRLLGLTEAELLELTIFDLTHPDDVAETRRVFEAMRASGGQHREFDKRYVRRDGRLVWAHIVVAPILDAEGRTRSVVAQVEDITERRMAEARLRESERRFRLLVEGVSDYALFMLDPEGRITSWNAGAQRIKGYQAEQVLGRHFEMFFTAEDRAGAKPQRALHTARDTGRFADEGWRLRKDGSRFWALAVLDAIHDEDGVLIGFAKITRDITERRQAEQRVRESEARLLAFTDHSPALMCFKDSDGRYRFVNAQFLERYGFQREQVLGRRDDELFPRAQAMALTRGDAEVIAGGKTLHFEETARERVSMVSKFPVLDATGAITGVGVVATDITDRRLTEQALREQRRLLAEAQKIAGLGSWEWDPENGRVVWSDELYRIYGVEAASFKPSFESYLERVHPEDRQQSGAMLARALMDGRGFTMQERIVRPGGEVRYLRSHGEVVRNDRGKPIKVLGASLDVTEQRHSESALRQAAQDLHALTRKLVQAEEGERRRIARELHDSVGQALSALNINLDIIHKGAHALPEALQRRLEDSGALVDRTLQSIEAVMAELRPPLLDEYGLGAALGWHAEEFIERTGIHVILADNTPDGGRSLRTDAAVALFRIAQEAMNNILKHARAKTVSIEMSVAGGAFALDVRDDGIGFDPANTPRDRWGMTTMRERAEAAGGELTVESAAGRGTRVMARIPI